MKSITSAVFITAIAVTCWAAEPVGTAVIDGQKVQLFDDGTWKPIEAKAESRCPGSEQFKSEVVPVSVCLDPIVWKKMLAQGEFEFMWSTRDRTFFAGLITEPLPLAMQTLKEAVLINADSGGTLDRKTIVEGIVPQTINGYEVHTLQFKTKLNGTDFTFLNAYSSMGDQGAVQVVFWTVSTHFQKNLPRANEVLKTIGSN